MPPHFLGCCFYQAYKQENECVTESGQYGKLGKLTSNLSARLRRPSAHQRSREDANHVEASNEEARVSPTHGRGHNTHSRAEHTPRAQSQTNSPPSPSTHMSAARTLQAQGEQRVARHLHRDGVPRHTCSAARAARQVKAPAAGTTLLPSTSTGTSRAASRKRSAASSRLRRAAAAVRTHQQNLSARS